MYFYGLTSMLNMISGYIFINLELFTVNIRNQVFSPTEIYFTEARTGFISIIKINKFI